MNLLKIISEKIDEIDNLNVKRNTRYCNSRNLNIDISTNEAVINSSILGTKTETRVGGEDSDADIGRSSIQLGTKTVTLTSSEGFDDDADLYSQRRVVETKTLTESQEVTDSDK